MPKKIIILRHGEKADPYQLCSVGVERSLGLEAQYLGQGASSGGTLFKHGETPAAFFAITLHTIELASPSAQSWNLPLITYSSVPIVTTPPAYNPFSDSEIVLNARTQQAAADVMSDVRKDEVIVMVWEHKHIADKKLEDKYPNEKVTLRQLLGLDTLSGVPNKWEGDNYDYFWVVDYDGASTPNKFTSIKQTYTGTYANLPQNDWGVAATLPSDCES